MFVSKGSRGSRIFTSTLLLSHQLISAMSFVLNFEFFFLTREITSFRHKFCLAPHYKVICTRQSGEVTGF